MRCTYCGSKLHTEKNCPKTHGGRANRQVMRCTYCGGRDHLHQACPKLHRGQEGRDPADRRR